MKKLICALIAASLLLPLCSCRAKEEAEYYENTFFAMDSPVTLKLARDTGKLDDKKKSVYFADEQLSVHVSECERIMKSLEALISATDEASAVSEINAECDAVFDIDETAFSIFELAYKLSDITLGAFDPTLGTLTALWNIKNGGPVPSDEALAEALSHTGCDKIELKENAAYKKDRMTKIDLGGVGKGYALQKMVEYLDSTDIVYGLVSVGGNVGVFGAKPEDAKFKIGIADPENTSEAVGYYYISSGFVSTSGAYERFFEENGVRYHHIFDPATGRPAVSDMSSVTVVASSGAISDALSTAFFVMGTEAALELYGNLEYSFEAIFVLPDGSVKATPGISSQGAYEDATEAVTEK